MNGSSSNVFVNDIKMILTHSIIEDSIDKLTIINHLRNDDPSASSLSELQKFKELNVVDAVSPSQQKKQKKLEINAINQIIHKLRENSNVMENKLNIQSLVNEPNSSTNKKSKELQFLSVVRTLKNELQKSLESALKEFEVKAECASLNEIIQHEELTVQRRNEMTLMVKQIKQKIECLQTTSSSEEKQFNSDVISSKKQIVNLKEQIRALKKQIEVDQKLKKFELIAQLNTNQRQHKIAQQSLNVSLDDARKVLQREITTSKATRSFLKNKLEVLEGDSQRWQEKYSTETSALKETLNKVREKREATLSALQEAEVEYDREKSIHDSRIEEERKKKEMEEKVYSSAIRIQKMTRGFLCRLRLKREKEAKSKGKGKKGGKKGKKGKKGK